MNSEVLSTAQTRCPAQSDVARLFHNHSTMSGKPAGMHNTEGINVDLYIPRKWYARAAPTISRPDSKRRTRRSLFLFYSRLLSARASLSP